MKIIILEGIATSGKTTLLNLLKEGFEARGDTVNIIDEKQTLMPILEDRSAEANINLCKRLMDEVKEKKTNYIIFDRFYFSHIFRTRSNGDCFKEIYQFLKDNSALAILLTVNTKDIYQRIVSASEYRDESWLKFVESKGNKEEIEQYYTVQQKKFLELFGETKLENKIFDATENNYIEIAELILKTY
jgi:thymidylate kinase